MASKIKDLILGILPVLTGLVVAGLLFGVIYLAIDKFPGARNEIINLWQPILAMIVMLLVIGLLAGAYTVFKLSNHSFALGLPSGSIRAILALSFIVIFTTVSILLLSDPAMNTEIESMGTIDGLTQTEFEAYMANLDKKSFKLLPKATDVELPQSEGAEAKRERRYGGQLYQLKASKDGLDIAKQILTALITALSVVTGFYFGSRTVTSNLGTELPTDESKLDFATGSVTKIDKTIAMIRAIETNVKERIGTSDDSDINDLITVEHEEIVEQMAIAEEAGETARTVHAEMVSETDDAKLTAAVEKIDAARETAERALAQAQEAMSRTQAFLKETPELKND